MSQLVGHLGGAHLVQPVVHIHPPLPKRLPQTINDETTPTLWSEDRIN